jgi:hypothetical protein
MTSPAEDLITIDFMASPLNSSGPPAWLNVYPHCSAIAEAMPENVLLLSFPFLGVKYQPFVNLRPFGVV